MRRKGYGVPSKQSSRTMSAGALDKAIQLHQRGGLQDALVLYDEILKTNPKHFDALRMSAMVHFQKGDLQEAEKRFLNAINVKADYAPVYCDYGLTLQKLGRIDEAISNYDKAISIDPRFSNAHFNRGVALISGNKFDDAILSYDRAIHFSPGHTKAHLNRGFALFKLNRLEEAVESFNDAIRTKADSADAYYSRGVTFAKLKRTQEAVASFDKAIAINPFHEDAYYNRGCALEALQRLDEALANYDKALALKPDFPEAHYNRGSVFYTLKRFDDALACFDQALAIKPDYFDAQVYRGNTLKELLRFEDALESYEQAILINPRSTDAHVNRGSALIELKRFDDAIAGYFEAASRDPNAALIYNNMSHLLLLIGNFKDGLEFYEWRKKTKEPVGNRDFDKPLWLGQTSLRGRTILVHEEQGVGDVIQFCRYVKLLAAEGAKVIFAVPEKLSLLMQSLGGGVQVCLMSEIPPAFDFHCPLMSLPLAFKTDAPTIPAQAPYLAAAPERVSALRRKLSGNVAKKVCGLSWRSKAGRTGDKRSVDLAKLFDVIDPEGYVFVSLQYGDVSGEIAALKDAAGIEIVSIPEIDNFADMDGFAALVDACDVVLSIDNTTVHMAGALNKTTFLMLPYLPDWRWLLDREDSPWYPSMRLFRQESHGNWDGVFRAVSAALVDARGA